MNTLPALLRPFISRIAAIAVTALVGLLLSTFQIEVKPDDAQQLVSAAEVLIGAALLAVYSVAHKLISRKTNPMDAASPAASKPSTAVKIGAVPPKEG